MSTITKNLGLIKPELTDPADITALNPNWDKLDEKLEDITNIPVTSEVPSNSDIWIDPNEDSVEQSHINDKNNPHGVTAQQLGIYLQTFTNFSQIGLSGAVTVDQVCEALPESGCIFLWANSTSGVTDYVSDVPMNFMNLEFYKVGARCVVEGAATGTMNPRSFEGSWHVSSRWSGWREKLTSILNSAHYGTALPTAGTPGRIFFKKVSS